MTEKNVRIGTASPKFDDALNDSWMSFFIDRKRFTWLIVFLIGTAGYFGYSKLDLESSPEVQIRAAVVTTTFKWATPESVEDLVTKKIEQKIAKVKWIDSITSTSMEGNSVISVEFESDADIQQTLSNLKDKVDEAKAKLPADAEEPSVKEVSMDDSAIWTFSISWEKYDGFELRSYAKKIQDELEKNTLVSEVDISWGKEKELRVSVDQKKLESYGLTLDAVNAAISSANATSPIGDMKISGYKHSVSMDSRYYDVEALKNVVMGKRWESGIVYLKDVAEVAEAAKETTSISRLSVSGWNSLNAVTLSVKKKRWWSIINLIGEWKVALEDMKNSGIIPKDLNVKTTLDESKSIQEDYHHLIRDWLLTIVLVFFTLFAIIWLKEALVAWTAVPLVLFVTFWAMSAYWLTLNFLSMFALILSLGLLVDDAIVVISAMNQYRRGGGLTAREAAILVIRDYKKVLVTTTLTVVFIFASMMFMDGMMGKFIFSIPFVMVVTLLSSLFIAMTLNPALAVMISWNGTKSREWKNGFRNKIREFMEHGFVSLKPLEDNYGRAISWLVSKTVRVKTFLIVVLALFATSLVFPATGLLKVDFFPKWDEDNFTINIAAEAGTELDRTSEIAKQVESTIVSDTDVDSFSTSIGSDSDWTSGSHYANLTVNLKESRSGTSMEIAKRVRTKLAGIKDATVKIIEKSSGPSAWSDFEIKVTWEDFAVLDKVAEEMRKLVSGIPWAVNVESSRKSLPFEFSVKLDKEKAALYEVSPNQVASFLRNVISGNEVTTIYKGEDEIKVKTSYDLISVDDLDKIKDLKFKNGSGKYVTIRDVADLNFNPTVFSIKRSDQKRVVSITAGADSTTSGMQIMSEFNKKTADYALPEWYSFVTGWSNETSSQAMSGLFTAMLYGLVCVVGLLVLLYDSYKQAFLVMLTIPLSLIGVFYWLTLFNTSLSFPGMIGMVALFGIVVRNGIILFDKINSNLKDGMAFKEAIIDAWRSRLEPVFLTSVCTALWMVPLTVSTPDWRSLGLAIICWLLTSTVLTLLALPSIYYMVFKKKYWLDR